MTRPTLVDGNIWNEDLANASIRPFISELDESGSTGELVKDDQLDNGTDQIKARFYGWYNRIQVSVDAGLTLAYTGATVVNGKTGDITTIAPGTLILPASSTVFIYVNTSAVVAYGTTLPFEGILIAEVTTDGSSITNIADLRHQTNEQIRPLGLPADSSPFYPGMVMPTMATSAPPGWLLCQGQAISRSDYSALFSAIGTTHGAGNGSTTFNLPDLRGRVLVGAGTGTGLSTYTLGGKGGAESVRLTTAQMPSHTHAASDSGHTHAIQDDGHTHGINDPGHDHNITDPGHTHPSNNYRRVALEGAKGVGGAEISQVVGEVLATIIQAAQTGISIIGTTTGITTRSAKAGVFASPSTTGITIGAQGGNGNHENRQPYAVCNYIIRTI